MTKDCLTLQRLSFHHPAKLAQTRKSSLRIRKIHISCSHELEAWELMPTDIWYWTRRTIWGFYSSPHGIPRGEAHLSAHSFFENWKEHSEAGTAIRGDSVFPLLLPKTQTNPPTELLLQILTSSPLPNTSPGLSSDSPVSVDNLVRVLLFSKIMPRDFPCNKGKYWKSRVRIQLKWNIHLISNIKDYVSKLILHIIRKCRWTLFPK